MTDKKPMPDEIYEFLKGIEYQTESIIGAFEHTASHHVNNWLVVLLKTIRAYRADLAPAGDGEWFYRWIARGKGGHTPMDQAIEMIWNAPDNPYAENNPWAVKTPTPTEAIRNESAETFHTQDHVKRAERKSQALGWASKAGATSKEEADAIYASYKKMKEDEILKIFEDVFKRCSGYFIGQAELKNLLEDLETIRQALAAPDHTELLREAVEGARGELETNINAMKYVVSVCEQVIGPHTEAEQIAHTHAVCQIERCKDRIAKINAVLGETK